MPTKRRLAASAAASAFALILASGAWAQETTGAVQGRITDEQGGPVGRSEVVVTHVPTGTSTTLTTNAEGYYSARGLRVGGPYTVTARAAGFQEGSTQVAAIGVGAAEAADVTMRQEGSVAEVVVTGAASIAPAAFKMGPATNFSEAQIEALPTISRDLKDIARIDVFATIDPTNSDALSCAGANTRFNQLTIDGIRQNDDFGLNNNGYPTQRSPISLEVIEAIQVSVAPYSPLNNGFLGCSLNAVTKSGSNSFHGSLYGEYTSDDYRGDSIRGATVISPFKEKTWGATFGGPIVRDRLFFFVGYEKFESEFSLDEGPLGSGKTTIIPRISTGAVDAFVQATQSIYAYEAGSWVDGAPPVADEKIFARVDWNITDEHRAAFAYQRTQGNSFNGSSSSSFASGNSVTMPAIGLESRQYDKNELLESYSLQVNSDWNDRFSTELRLSSKETDTTQLPVVGGLEVGTVAVRVQDLPGVEPGAGTPEIRFGPDNFRHDNYLNVKTKIGELIARYRTGSHDLLAGGRIEQQDIFNVFVSRSLGDWLFNSYADYLNRTAARFLLTGAVDPAGGTVPATLGTARQGAAAFRYQLYSLYAEDNWQAAPGLQVLLGARFDWYGQGDEPTLNDNFVSRHGFANTATVDGKSVILPRVGFTYRPSERWDLAGGVGRFSSQGLNVWLSNPFANDGVRQTNAVCTPNGPFLNVDLSQAPAGCTFTPGNGDTNAVDPDLKIPTVWKASLSAGYNFDLGPLGDRWRVQADFLYGKFEDSLIWRDLRSVATGTAPDGRPLFGRTTTGVIGANNFDLLLTNSDNGGTARVAALTLQKSWREGWAEGLSVKGTYTHTRAEDRNPMTSSIGLSSYTRFATEDPNDPDLATSDYEVRNRWALQVSWARALFGDNKTAITVFAQHRSGLPFSYTFSRTNVAGSTTFDDVFGNVVTSYSGRQATSNQLFYVPQTDGSGQVSATSDPLVTYAAGFDLTAFNAFLTDSGLVNHAGKIAPRNAFRGPKLTTVDIRISQELPAFVPRGAKLTAYLDIENFTNLLNDEWGSLEQYDFYRGVPVVQPAIVGGRYVYSGAVAAPAPFVVNNASLWQIKFGLKYEF